MNRPLNTLFVIASFAALANAADKKLQIKDLPPAVQKTVQEQLKGAEVKGIAKETENGKDQYEIEPILDGKHGDFNVDSAGPFVVVEEETALASIPAAAKAAIEKKV